MIARITGHLTAVEEGRALVTVGGITYSVLISPSVAEELAANHAGREVTLHTFHYIEGSAAMGNLIPRVVGFLSEADLEFFSRLISVPGVSVKKGLRSMVIPAADMARAIESNDQVTLKRLPEIGGKTAQKIVMELKGKLTKFVLGEYAESVAFRGGPVPDDYRSEAVEVLAQLEYSRMDAEVIVMRTAENHPEITTADALIQEIFRTHQFGGR